MNHPILIIGQSRFLAEHVGRELAKCGCTQWEVLSDPLEALSVVGSVAPSCVILDANMPGENLAAYCTELVAAHATALILTYSPVGSTRERVQEARNVCPLITQTFESPFAVESLAAAVMREALEAPAPPSMKEEPTHGWLKSHPEVTGYALLSSQGYMLETTGGATADHCGVLNYLRDMGRALGSEIGLENLLEMQFYSKEARILSTEITEGSVNVIATTRLDLKAAAARLQGGRLL